jgi:hypothetical protein
MSSPIMACWISAPETTLKDLVEMLTEHGFVVRLVAHKAILWVVLSGMRVYLSSGGKIVVVVRFSPILKGASSRFMA